MAESLSHAGSLTPEELESLLNKPAAKNPSGEPPDFSGPNTMIPALAAVVTVTYTVSTLAIISRVYTKLRVMKEFHIEDYLIILGWLATIAEVVPAMYTVQNGVGRHIWDVRLRNVLQMLYWVNNTAIAYGLSVVFIKVAILLQLRRIFVPHRKTNIVLWIAFSATIVVTTVFYFVHVLFTIIQCVPREKLESPWIEGYCFDTTANFKASGIFNVVSDFTIFLLPIVPLLKLQVNIRRKIALILLFATGLFGCAASIARTYSSYVVYSNSDTTYYMVFVGFWTWAEMAAGVLVYCLPSLPRLMQSFKPKFPASTQHSQSRYQGQAYQMSKQSSNPTRLRPDTASSFNKNTLLEHAAYTEIPDVAESSTARSRHNESGDWTSLEYIDSGKAGRQSLRGE